MLDDAIRYIKAIGYLPTALMYCMFELWLSGSWQNQEIIVFL